MIDACCFSSKLDGVSDAHGSDAELDAQSDDDDLYAGLQCDAACDDGGEGTIVHRLQQQQIKELKEMVSKKDEQLAAMHQQLEAKDAEIQQLSAERLVLLTNISSLFKTAQAEIKRHTTQLQASRLEVVQLKTQAARAQQQQQQGQKQKQQGQLQQKQGKAQQRQQQGQKLQQQADQQQQQKKQATPLGDITGLCENQSVLQQPRVQHIQQGAPVQQRQLVGHHPQKQQQHRQHASSGQHASAKRSRSRSPVHCSSSRPADRPAEAVPLTPQLLPSCAEHTSASAIKRARTGSKSPARMAASAGKGVRSAEEQYASRELYHSSGSSRVGRGSSCRTSCVERDRGVNDWDRDRDRDRHRAHSGRDRDRDRDASWRGRDKSPGRQKDRVT